MRVVFLGTGDIALPCLKMLIESDWIELIGVVTQPDKPVGRKQVMTPPQIKVLAQASEIVVEQPENVSSEEFIKVIEDWAPDVIIVMAYGQILRQNVLNAPKVACINVHASLLPKYRGASCIQAAIANGDQTTGITIMHMVRQLDAGDIILQKFLPIEANDTGGVIHDKLAELSPKALEEALVSFSKGTATRVAQVEEDSTYASKLLRSDGEIDWTKSAVALERMIRAYDPWPGTYTVYEDAKGKVRRLKIFPQTKIVEKDETHGEPGQIVHMGEAQGVRIACGSGMLMIENVQPEGKQRMLAQDFLRGFDHLKCFTATDLS